MKTLIIQFFISTFVNAVNVKQVCKETLDENSDLIFNATEYDYMYQKCVDRFSSRFNDSTYNYKSSSNVDSGPNWFFRGVFGLILIPSFIVALILIPSSYKHKNKSVATLVRLLILTTISGLLIYIGPPLLNYFFDNGSILWWVAISIVVLSILVSLNSIFDKNNELISSSDIEMALSENDEYFYKYKKDALIALAKYFDASIKNSDTKKSIQSQIYKALAERMNSNVYGNLDTDESDCWENLFGELLDLEEVHKELVKKKKGSDFLKKLKEMEKK